jgi:phosphate:Na+ symporter
VHYQVTMRLTGALLMGLLWSIDALTGGQTIDTGLSLTGLPLPARLAAVFLLMQLLSDLGMRVLQRPALALIERYSPPSEVEALGRPAYLHDEALAEPESALLLVELEQHRLLAGLPVYLAALRSEDAGPAADSAMPAAAPVPEVAARRSAEAGVLQRCEQFLAELPDRHNSRTVLDRALVLRDRNELIGALQETLVDLNQAVDLPGVDARQLCTPLVESLHLMLQTLADAGRTPDADDLALLRLLTHDRSEMMDALRRRLQGEPHAAAAQQAAFSATALFERCVWLLRRYVLLLEPGRQPAA